MARIKVLHVCDIFSIRTAKEVIAQQSAGAQAYVMYRHNWHTGLLPFMFHCEAFDRQTFMFRLKAMVQGVDVVQVHTTIATQMLLSAVRSVAGDGAKIVWDMHDFVNTPVTGDLLKMANGVVCPSKGMAKRVEMLGAKTVDVVYSMVPMALHPVDLVPFKRRVNAAVLVSGIHLPNSGDAWRDYTMVQERLSWPMFIYPDQDNEALATVYHHVMHTQQYPKLMTQLPWFMAGYAGANNDQITIHDCVTNKFWEYVACGVPPITYRADEMSRLVEEEVHAGAEILNLDDDLDENDFNCDILALSNTRKAFTMESQLPKLDLMYEKVMS